MVATTETMSNSMAKKDKGSKPAKAARGAAAKSTSSSTDKVSDGNPHLKTALQQIEKQFGEGAIMALGAGTSMTIEGIPTGSLSLDIALGGQGIPRGRIIEVFGPESSGKTTLALHVAAEAQKLGGIAAMIDAEHAFDPSWGKKIGDSHVGLQARLMSQSMRKLTGAIAKSKTAVIFINQIREKIGVMFGSPETTPGGRALKFYSSCRIDVRRIGQLKDGDVVVGQRVRCKVVKNKVAPPFRIAEFDMMHTNGISFEGDVLDLAVAQKVVARSGSWFKYGETHLGQGKEKARSYLIENPTVTQEITQKVMAAGGYGIEAASLSGDADGDADGDAGGNGDES